MPPPKPATDAGMLCWLTAKLPLPVMLVAVGAWPISSALAGRATATPPTSRPRAIAPVAMTLVERRRRKASRGRASVVSCMGVAPLLVRYGPGPAGNGGGGGAGRGGGGPDAGGGGG